MVSAGWILLWDISRDGCSPGVTKPRCALCSPVGGGDECCHRVGIRKTSRAVTPPFVPGVCSPPPSPRRTVSDITRREVWTRTNLHFSFMPPNCSSTQKVRDLTGGSRKIYVALLWGRICLMWQFNPLRKHSARSQNIKHSKSPPIVAALTLRAADYCHFLLVCFGLEKGIRGTLLKHLHLLLRCETFSLNRTESRFWEAKRQHRTPIL